MLKGSSEMSLGLGMETCCLVSSIMRSAKRVLQRMGGLFGLKDLVKSVKSRLRYLLNYCVCHKSTSLQVSIHCIESIVRVFENADAYMS